MAAWFVDSVQGIGGTGSGTSWANAALTLTAGFALAAAGDTIWVGDDHAESTASAVTLTSPGTVGNPCFVYCVDHTVASPGTGNLKTTATVTTTGNNAITQAGVAYFYGITLTSGSGANSVSLTLVNTSSTFSEFEACVLAVGGTSGGNISSSNTRNFLILKNTVLKFASVSSSFMLVSGLNWIATPSAIAGSVPTSLIGATTSEATLILEGVDLSALTSGKTIVAALTDQRQVFLKDCQLGASVTVAGTPTVPGSNVFLVRSDGSATNYRNEKYSYTGTETTETSITRVGGASDGTTPQSRKYVTTANSKWVLPFQGLPIAVWNAKVGVPVTVTLFGTWNSAAVPNNDDFWLNVEYLGTAGNPLGVFATNTKANNLATGTPLTSDNSTWNGGGSGAGWSPFKIAITFTPNQAGTIYIYPNSAKVTSTFYLDPKAVLS